MSTTYDRVRAGIHHAKRRREWESLNQLAADILERKVPAFRRASALTDEYFKLPSIRSTLVWGRAFGLLEEDEDGKVRVTEKGLTSIESDDAFARQLRASIKSHLEENGLPFESVLKIIDEIELPDVPDGATISDESERLEPVPNLKEGELRTLLFMLSCAGGLGREVKVIYKHK
jgi:hypothetical protein